MLAEKIMDFGQENDTGLAVMLDNDISTEARTLVVDLDNTLFGAMQALEEELDWYFIEGQTRYVFDECWEPTLAKEALSLFHDESVLKNMPFIPEVENMIAAMMVERHDQILLVSKTRPENMELRYRLAMQNSRLAPYIKGIVVWQRENPISFLKEHMNIKSMIDDNPTNLEAGRLADIFTIKVAYPYNEGFIADMSVYPSSVFTRYRTVAKQEMIEGFQETRLAMREQCNITSSDFLDDLKSLCEMYGFEGNISISANELADDEMNWGRGDLLYREGLSVKMDRINRTSLADLTSE